MDWWDRLKQLHPDALELVRERTVERHYAAGAVLCREGDQADGMYLLESGRVLVQSVTIDGAPVGLNVIDAGQIVGEQALLADGPRTATVTAVRPTQVRLLRRTAFAQIRDERPEIDRLLLAVLDERLREMSNRLAEAVHSTAEERVCRRLFELGTAFDGMVRLSQATIASLSGTTRPTVNRVLQDLSRSEVVRLRRARVEILDEQALEKRIPLL